MTKMKDGSPKVLLLRFNFRISTVLKVDPYIYFNNEKQMIDRNWFLIISVLLFASCTSSSPLFLNSGNWQLNGAAGWQFDQDMIIGESEGEAGYLVSNQSFTDFVLELEFNPSSELNSGIFIRCEGTEMTPNACYEFNIWDENPNQEYRTGAIVMKSNPIAKVNTIGKWNTYKIKAKGNSLQAWVNGQKVSDIKDSDLASGFIGLQAAKGGKVMFRNITIKEI